MKVGKNSATRPALEFKPVDKTEQEKAYDAHDQRSAEEAAAEVGCTVLYSTDHTVQLDIDSEVDLLFFEAQWQRLLELGTFWSQARIERMASKNGNHHIVITLPKEAPALTIEQRVMFQALLGSDRVREILNYTRHYWGAENPIRLFRPKEEATTIPVTLHDDLPW